MLLGGVGVVWGLNPESWRVGVSGASVVGVAVFFLWFVVVGCLGSFSGLGWFRVLRLVRAILVRLF